MFLDSFIKSRTLNSDVQNEMTTLTFKQFQCLNPTKDAYSHLNIKF